MRIYYQDPQICVASSGVWVNGYRYPLHTIERAWRSGRRRAGRRVVIAAALLPIIIAAELSVGVLGWWVIPGSGVLLLATILLVHVIARLIGAQKALQAVEDIRQYGRHLELWASISRSPVLLFETDDALRYGQVCRALTRALNARDRARRMGAADGQSPGKVVA
jgi:Family of unknown function (DUF6232)